MEFRIRGVICFLLLILIPNLLIAQAPEDLEKLSLDQKVGQLFIIGFPQQKMDPQLAEFIKKYHLSSFILFKRNIATLSQVARMNSELQHLAFDASGTLPLIAVDQEGGQVARVPTRPPIPNAMSIGQTQDPELARSLGQETAKIIRTLGFNMNLAPVLDVSDPEIDSFIGVRSFGNDAAKVSAVGVALSRGMLDDAVIPTAKHFPGVGSVVEDPHKEAVEYTASAQQLFERDLKPFTEFAKIGPNSAIMMSHLSYPNLDPTHTPATLSPKIIKEILRKKLGFQGLVITDDIQMKGLADISNPHEAALKALKAGADVIMMTWSFKDQSKAIERVKQAVASGELPLSELNERVARVLAVKSYLQNHSAQIKSIQDAKVVALSTKRLREIESRILDFNIRVAIRKSAPEVEERTPAATASAAVTPGAPPIGTTPATLTAAAPSATLSAAADNSAATSETPQAEQICVFAPNNDFIQSFKKSSPNSLGIKTTARTSPKILSTIIKDNNCSYGVYAVFGPKTATILEEMPAALAQKLLVINLSNPSLVTEPTKFLNVVNLYSPHPEAGERVAQNLRALARPPSGAVAHTETKKRYHIPFESM